MATIIDVAKRAGVAVTTVSRVMNNKGQVSAATRDRVLAAIEELAYTPSPAARSLPRGRMHTISVVVPFVTNPSAVARVQGMVQGFRDIDLPVSIFDVEAPHHKAEHFSMLATSYRPEGAIIVSLRPNAQQLDQFSAAGICPVFVDADVDRFSCVLIDNRAGGALATEHLIELGHERIAFVGDFEDPEFGFESSTSRRQGYRAALAAANLECNPEYERMGEHGRGVSRGLAEELLALRRPPTAVFASSDTQAFGVVEAARDAGLRVPDDLSVIGFDDIESARYTGLTTIRQPLYESGLTAARLVTEHLANPDCAPDRVELELEVIVRTSTAPPSS